ncbi:protein-S-isoprenylcysteine O-methyltransferase [Sitodiplosis mosellana]|uniref:protein-S-isoprenylcysteine O-methyltransferase n=1 Tax=Sitodiplosis mosellana TaxID=263140 RepID=UPI0024446A71|nr:protein-S-isoprenylcysteine O-methyltransferase [Sitodiplosis mosellana]
MWCHEGKVSLAAFISGIITTVFTSLLAVSFFSLELNTFRNFGLVFIGPIGTYALFCLITFFVTSTNDFAVVKRATALGVCFGLSVISIYFSPIAWKRLGVYFLFMSTFHFSEYITISWANPQTLSTDTFMLNHSIAYLVAATTSWLEFLIEVYMWPGLKGNTSILLVGVVMCVSGEILRKLAIVTASKSFNHIVQYQKSEDHVLVTHGVYRLCRHPSYAGWFWWSIGTQIILANPICSIVYSYIVYRFFYERILVEEVTLVNFFQEKYVAYQNCVPTGLPFVNGYVGSECNENELSFTQT